jgi:accessory gene regulator protein AgrB
MGRTLVGLIVAIPMALWVFHSVKKQEKHPTAWAIFTLLAWPIPSVIIGYRYRRWVMFWVGCLGVDLLLASVVVLCSVLTTAEQIPVSNLLLGLIPLTILSLVSLVLIAKRCHGRLYGFIHVCVVLTLLNSVMWPWVWRYIQSMAPDANKFSWLAVAATIYNCIFIAAQLALLWLGFILGEKEARRRFKRPIILWSIAIIAAFVIPAFASALAVYFVNRNMFFESVNSMNRVLYWCVNLPVYTLPPLILLIGVLKENITITTKENEQKEHGSQETRETLIKTNSPGYLLASIYFVLATIFTILAIGAGSKASEKMSHDEGYTIVGGGRTAHLSDADLRAMGVTSFGTQNRQQNTPDEFWIALVFGGLALLFLIAGLMRVARSKKIKRETQINT